MTFAEFGLHNDLLDGIDAMNFITPTPIQEQSIPLILQGRDLIGTAQTGTGKTAAFVLPVLDLILDDRDAHYCQALIIVPTRELAVQIDQMVAAYSYFTGISSIAVYGGSDGKSFSQERTALSQGADIIIATPGRLIAHLNMGYVDFSRLRFLILDEADRLLDMGFQPDLLKIIKTTNPNRQSLLFSATMPAQVMKLARTLLHNPATVSIALSKPAEGVTQAAYLVPDAQKFALVADILKDKDGQRILVFGSTKQAVSQLYQRLRAKNLPVGHISSDLEQEQREQVMQDFRNRKVEILVATDVVSRGIDVEGIDMVINFDVPRDAEDYVHRVGRTARAARTGTALTLISPTDVGRFKRIEALIGRTVEKLPLPAHLASDQSQNRNESRGNRSHAQHKGTSRGKSQETQSGGREKQPKLAPAGPGASTGNEQEAKAKRPNRRRRGGRGRRPEQGGEG